MTLTQKSSQSLGEFLDRWDALPGGDVDTVDTIPQVEPLTDEQLDEMFGDIPTVDEYESDIESEQEFAFGLDQLDSEREFMSDNG